MKYNPPFGSVDPNASFVDRNTAAGTSGSRVPAAAIEHPQREIAAVIAAAGIDPSNADLTQLLQAIQFLIAQSTGEGGDANFVLMTEARTRLRIFPEVLTSDGRLPVTSPTTGQVRIPAGYDFLHRGIFNVTTVQTDFATVANKTYHLRWNKTIGYALKDLADVVYNPAALSETDAVFDSGYDDMLIARVVTSGANVATITNLVNKDRLRGSLPITGVVQALSGQNGARFSFNAACNWARTPITKALTTLWTAYGTPGGSDQDLATYSTYPTVVDEIPVNRYGTSFVQLRDYQTSVKVALDIGA